MTESLAITIVEDSAFDACMVDIGLLLAQCPPEFRECFLRRVIDVFERGLAFDLDASPTVSAGELKVSLRPAEALLALVAAARAGNFQGDGFAHGADDPAPADHRFPPKPTINLNS